MLHDFEFFIAEPEDAVSELSSLCLQLERFGLVSEYVFSTIHNVLGHIYAKEVKKVIKEMDLESSAALGSDFFPSDLIRHVKNSEQFIIDYRNSIAFVVNSNSFLDDDELFDAAKSILEMR